MWALLWFVLVAVAATTFVLLGRRLFHQTKALTAELRTASDRLAAVSSALQDLEAARGEGAAGVTQKDAHWPR